MNRWVIGVSIAALCACGDNLDVSRDARTDTGSGAGDGGIDGAFDAAIDAPPDAMIIYPAGALVGVTATSQVGVLLDDFPAASRDRLATAFLAQPPAFWTERAKQQIRLTTLRLIYREYFYPEASGRDSLPLTEPTEWQITLDAAGARRTTVDGHDLIVIDYAFATTLLTDEASPGVTEPALATIGGVWTESFVFPVDPTLLLQRTGYACMDEDQFPPESVDEENAWEFYDDYCLVEGPGSQSCHLTLPLPNKSCVRAVRDAIGRVDVDLTFERLPWDATVAQTVRRGQVTQQDAPDLSVVIDGHLGLANNRIIYRYFPPGHCALLESCVGGPGWRRLLAFDSYDHNVGAEPIHIGAVDYAVEGFGSELIDHNVYELSACHNHYHFEYYGDFRFGTATEIHKNGFCLESTGRISNNELSPLHTPYSCELQGVSPGWGDLYAAGLACNWVDVTGVNTSAGPVTQNLTFVSNPDGFICEGALLKDADANQIWEPTSFTTSTGDPVDRPACDEAPNTEANDTGTLPVTVPQRGGMLTSACTDPQTLGPTRNCGFTAQPTLLTCTPGATVDVLCTGGATTKPQVVRLCETSRALGSGVDCVHRDALANFVIEAGSTVSVTCPSARDALETGGQIAIYTAPVYAPDGAAAVACLIP